MKPKDKVLIIDTKSQNKARKAYEEAVYRAFKAYIETKEQADIAHERALRQTTDNRTKEEADIKYQETIAQARKVRDEVMDEAGRALSDVRE